MMYSLFVITLSIYLLSITMIMQVAETKTCFNCPARMQRRQYMTRNNNAVQRKHMSKVIKNAAKSLRKKISSRLCAEKAYLDCTKQDCTSDELAKAVQEGCVNRMKN